MSWGLEALALDDSADERAIKRAYAQRLRVTRPDEDPVAFQQLHAAYQAALAWAQQQRQAQPVGVHAAAAPAVPVPATTPLPLPPRAAPEPPGAVLRAATADALPAQQPVDVADSARRILAQARQLEPDPLRAWLAQQPELWSLRSKPAVGDAVLAQLFEQSAPVAMASTEVLADTFDWHDLGSGIDPYVLHAHRLHLHRSWVVQPGNHPRLAELLRHHGLPGTLTDARDHVAWLSRPWRAWQALLTTLAPMRGRDVNRTLDVLGIDDAADAPAPLRPQQIAFWRRIGQRDRLNLTRGLQGLLRGVVSGLIMAALILGYGVLKSTEPAAWPLVRFAQLAVWAVPVLTVLGGLTPALHTLLHWQSADEPATARGRYPRLLLIPLLALAAVVLIHGLDLRVAGSVLAWSTLVLALVRFWRRSGLQFQFNGWLLLAALPLLKFAALMVVVAELSVVAAIVFWIWDGWRNVRGQWA